MFWNRAPSGQSPAQDEALRNNLKIVEMPDSFAFMAALIKILGLDLGFVRSQETGMPVLGTGEEIPMWSYGAVEYLMGLDLSAMDVLELGSGQSTVFLARRAKSVTAIETNADWAASLRQKGLRGVSVEVAAAHEIPARMAALGSRFDIVSIDPSANRFACAKAALALLKAGGFAVLDNSEWYPNAAEALRGGGLIQIDFHDFRPHHHYRTTTSLFLTPEFRPKPLRGRLPLVPIGGKTVPNNAWDVKG